MSRKGIQVSQHGSEATEHGGRMEKTMRAKKKKNPNPLEGTTGASTALGRRQKTPPAYHGRALLSPACGQHGAAPGPSPNISCSWAVIRRDVWGAVNISIYKT